MYRIEELSQSNHRKIAQLAYALWPYSSLAEEQEYFQKAIEESTISAFLMHHKEKSIGFVHVSLRSDYVEGTNTSPVCYIEGIYVKPEYRRKGYAQVLFKEAEAWGKLRKCKEIASDAQIKNEASIALHKHYGFREINRIVCFAKSIP